MGKILWQKSARQEKPNEKHGRGNSFASYSPVTDGKYVWAGFGSHGLHCYDVDGNHKWSVDLGKMKTDDEVGQGTFLSPRKGIHSSRRPIPLALSLPIQGGYLGEFFSESFSSLYSTLSTSASQLASMMFSDTPTVPQSESWSRDSIITRTRAAVPARALTTRTL